MSGPRRGTRLAASLLGALLSTAAAVGSTPAAPGRDPAAHTGRSGAAALARWEAQPALTTPSALSRPDRSPRPLPPVAGCAAVGLVVVGVWTAGRCRRAVPARRSWTFAFDRRGPPLLLAVVH